MTFCKPPRRVGALPPRWLRALPKPEDGPTTGITKLWSIVNRLVDETGNQQMRTAFTAAAALHTNLYEGWLPRENVEDYLRQVGDLLSTLESLYP